MKKLFDLAHDKFGLKTIFHVIMGVVILIAGAMSTLLIDWLFGANAPILNTVICSILNIAVIFLLIRFYIVKGFKMSLVDFRICKSKNIVIWISIALLLPFTVSCFFIFLTPGTFASSGLDKVDLIKTLTEAFFTFCLIAGITEELIFRGLIMRLLEMRWNRFISIIVPSVLFGVLHIFNMERFNITDVLLLVIAGTTVGIMFSLIAYQSGSIWTSALVHGIWNLFIIGGILDIGISVNPTVSIFTYTLESSTTLLTGGVFGIESSLPAVIGYIVVIFVALSLQRQTRNKNHPTHNNEKADT